MKLVTVMEKAELDKLQYMVVVEQWKQIGFGRGKRLFEKTFTADEQKLAAKLYKTYSRWSGGWTGGGQPDSHAMPLDVYNFALHLTNFFGTEL